MNRIVVQLAIWIAVLCLWVIVSRDHHPTLLIDFLATSVLVSASAVVFYINALVLWPRRIHYRVIWRYVFELVGLALVLDVIAVMVIQTLYDRLWGPDPLRYGLITNLLYEAIFIGLHLAVATAVLTIIRRRSAVPGKEST